MPTIDEYLHAISQPQRDEFERLRHIVKAIAPGAKEAISYGMPAYKYKDKPLIYFGSFKNHMSLFPTPGPTESLKERLAGYKTAKGTIQFTTKNPLPTQLIEDIIRVRLMEIETNKNG